MSERPAFRRGLGILLIKCIPKQAFGLTATVEAEEICAVWRQILGEKKLIAIRRECQPLSPSGLYLDRTLIAVQPIEHIFENLRFIKHAVAAFIYLIKLVFLRSPKKVK